MGARGCGAAPARPCVCECARALAASRSLGAVGDSSTAGTTNIALRGSGTAPDTMDAVTSAAKVRMGAEGSMSTSERKVQDRDASACCCATLRIALMGRKGTDATITCRLRRQHTHTHTQADRQTGKQNQTKYRNR